MMGRTDHVARVIAASPQALYDAFVDPAAQVRWLPPKDMSARFESFDARPGGAYRMTLTYKAGDHGPGKSSADSDTVSGRFIELVPAKRIVQTADFVSDDPAFAGTMSMTWTLEPVADGTRVTVTVRNVPSGISAEDHQKGIASTLANLAAFVE